MQKRIALALLAVVMSTGCTVESSDGEGAKVVSSKEDQSSSAAPESENAATEEAPEEPSNLPGTRQNPLPLGTTAAVGGWDVKLTTLKTDAAADVAKENQFNDPPPAGSNFVMIGIAATRTGTESGTFWVDMTTKFLGAAGNTFDDSCGVIPKDLTDEGETFPGANVAGNLCYVVPKDQIAGGSLLVEASFAFDEGDRTFFGLK